MLSIVLFAIIGATIEAGLGYWIVFSVFALCKAVQLFCKIFKFLDE